MKHALCNRYGNVSAIGPSYAALSLIAVLSLIYTGYEFGLSNNVFHIPYVLSWERLPQFHGNEFYLSLRYFTSAVWFLIRLIANDNNIQPIFFACHVLCRIGVAAGLFYMARTLGSSNRVVLLGSVLGTMLSPHLLAAYSGGHDMLNDYFTHTAVTWPFLLVCLGDWQASRFRRAALSAGIVFLVNAFVGIWLAGALAFSAIFNARDFSKHHLWQLPGIFVLTCLPVLVWIRFALGAGAATEDFSFAGYINTYFTDHFFLKSGNLALLIETAAVFISTLWLCVELKSRRLAAAVAGFIVIFGLGVVVPNFIDQRWVFNLHLLRVAGIVQFIFPLLALIEAWKRWQCNTWLNRASAVLIGVSVLNGLSCLSVVMAIALPRMGRSFESRLNWALLLSVAAVILGANINGAGQLGAGQFVGLYCASGMLLLSSKRLSRSTVVLWVVVVMLIVVSLGSALMLHAGHMRYEHLAALMVVWGFILATRLQNGFSAFLQPYIRLALVVPFMIMLMFAGATVIQRRDTRRDEQASFSSYLALTDWLKFQPPRGPLLVPLEQVDGRVSDPAYSRYNLQLYSRQPVWVDWKQGAAVMWQPAFHAIWRPRFEAVKQLKSADDYYSYAIDNDIRWMMLNDVVDSKLVPCPGTGVMPLFQHGRYRVCLTN